MVRIELWQGAEEESDRGFVIVAHSYLEESLKDLCESAFQANGIGQKLITKLLNSRSDEGPPPLQGFWMKAILAHAFGLLDAHLFESLVELNALRNRHGAHSPKRYKLRDEDMRRILSKLNANLASHIEKTADKDCEAIEDFHKTRAVAKAKGYHMENSYEKHTRARKLLEIYVYMVESSIEKKTRSLKAKD